MGTSEVDARDEKNSLVEIKSSGSKQGAVIVTASIALQVTCNGSDIVLCCGLDADKTHLLDVCSVTATEARERHRSSFVNCGQRVTLLLDRLCGEPLLSSAGGSEELGPVIQLTFNAIKVPILEPAPPDVRVLPLGLPLC